MMRAKSLGVAASLGATWFGTAAAIALDTPQSPPPTEPARISAAAPVDPFTGMAIPITPNERVIKFANGCALITGRIADDLGWSPSNKWLGSCREGVAHGDGYIVTEKENVKATFYFGHRSPTKADLKSKTTYLMDGTGGDLQWEILSPSDTDSVTKGVSERISKGTYTLFISSNQYQDKRAGLIFSIGEGECKKIDSKTMSLGTLKLTNNNIKDMYAACAKPNKYQIYKDNPGFYYTLLNRFESFSSNGHWVNEWSPAEIYICPEIPPDLYACEPVWNRKLAPFLRDFTSKLENWPVEYRAWKKILDERFAAIETARKAKLAALQSAYAVEIAADTARARDVGPPIMRPAARKPVSRKGPAK